MELTKRVIKPKGMSDSKEEYKTVLKPLHLLCAAGESTQILQEATRIVWA